MLEFNIGPSFLHMIFHKNFNGRTFSYLFDCSNCVGSNIFKDKAKEIKLSNFQTNVNTEKPYVLNVNIFKEKCGCEKCLSGSFQFYGSQPVNLINELFQVLKSEHCYNWNRCWIEMLVEQMFIFFSCIKNGVVYERLLECACDCASMLVIKHLKTDLLEYKYSYGGFIEKLMANFQLINKLNKNITNCKRYQSFYCNRDIGKVSFDLVDNFAVITFETEKEMNDFTMYENKIRQTEPQYLINLFRKSINGCKHSPVETTRSIRSKAVKGKEVSNIFREKERVVLDSDGRAPECVNESVCDLMKQLDVESMDNHFESKVSNAFVSKLCSQNTTNKNEFSKEKNNANNSIRAVKDLDKRVWYKIVEWNRIPVIHGCNKGLNKIVECTCNLLSLGMVLNLGFGRALSKEAVENLDLLENNGGTVTYRMATIAASAAVSNNGQQNTVRIIVPVVLNDIVNAAKLWQKWQKVGGKNVNASEVVDKESEQLLYDLIDEVCCSESDLCADIIDSDLHDKNNLNKSLLEDKGNQTAVKSIDAKKKNNISQLNNERSKREIKISSRFINSVFFDEASLPLASSVFHGSRSLGTQRRMEFVCDEQRKRRVKLIDDESVKRSKSGLGNNVCKKRKLDMIIDAWKKRGSSTVLRKLDFCVGNVEEKKTLADILIWCAYHNKYNCPCILSVCRMKHNLVIWQPPKILKYVTYKVMSKIEISQRRDSCQVYFFDSEEFCARTYGIPVNYSVRNSSELFSAKRLYELENNVTTSTNSFIKSKYLTFKTIERNDNGNEFGGSVEEELEEYYDVIRYECKENVHIVAEKQDENGSSGEINITDCPALSDFPDIVVISDNEQNTLSSRIKSNNSSDHLSDVNQTNINRYMAGSSQLTRNEHSVSLKTYMKHNRKVSKDKIADRDQDSNLQTDKTNLEENLITNSNMEQNMDAKILESHLQVCGKNVAEIEVNVKSPLKQLKTVLFQQNSIDITNYDSSLENCLMRLKDHPLKDDIYYENKLPKLALYCITPGIGYLPIVEYSPKALVVFDPIFPEVLHSFKNLCTANMWLNKFLKDFLVFESIELSLKWIIVKPGIIKMKQSQPFSPAIFENSPIIITKHGEIRFSKNDLIDSFENKRQEIGEFKRKFTGDTVVDINGSDGKRKKIHLDSLGAIRAKILTRTVKLVQQYPSKNTNSSISPTAGNSRKTLNQNSMISELNNNNNNNNSALKSNISTLNSNKLNVLPKQLKISPIRRHYQLIPANLLIQMNVPPSLLTAASDSLGQCKYGYISTNLSNDPVSSADSAPFTGVSNNFNNQMIITNVNPAEM